MGLADWRGLLSLIPEIAIIIIKMKRLMCGRLLLQKIKIKALSVGAQGFWVLKVLFHPAKYLAKAGAAVSRLIDYFTGFLF